jgi:hypothetical protein
VLSFNQSGITGRLVTWQSFGLAAKNAMKFSSRSICFYFIFRAAHQAQLGNLQPRYMQTSARVHFFVPSEVGRRNGCANETAQRSLQQNEENHYSCTPCVTTTYLHNCHSNLKVPKCEILMSWILMIFLS